MGDPHWFTHTTHLGRQIGAGVSEGGASVVQQEVGGRGQDEDDGAAGRAVAGGEGAARGSGQGERPGGGWVGGWVGGEGGARGRCDGERGTRCVCVCVCTCVHVCVCVCVGGGGVRSRAHLFAAGA